MLEVTPIAKEQLRKSLEKQETAPDVTRRLIRSESKQHKYELALDKEKEGDQIARSEDGRKVLLVGPDLAPALVEMVFDYVKTADDEGFIMTKSTSGP